MASKRTSRMLLLHHLKLVLKVARQLDLDIIDTTGYQRWYRIRVHGVELSRYGQEAGMRLLPDGILHGGDNT